MALTTGGWLVAAVLLAEQLAVVPPLAPAQLHDHGPEPETDEAEPVVQRLVVGAVETVVPFADPQAPLVGVAVLLAEQEAFVPPLAPVQDHDQGPEPLTLVAVPAVQRLVVGLLATVVPLADPQAPFVGGTVLLAEHDAVVP